MRKLLNTLFVINEDAYLTLDGENLVVTRNKQETPPCPAYAGRHRLLYLRRCQPRFDGSLCPAGH